MKLVCRPAPLHGSLSPGERPRPPGPKQVQARSMSTEREPRVSSASSGLLASPDASPPNLDDFPALVRADLGTRIRRDKLDTWFKHLTLASLNDKEVVFAVPSGFVRDFLTRNHLAELRRAVQNVGGHARAVRLIVNPMRPTDGDAARRASVEAVLDKITEEAPPLTSYEAEQRRTGEKRSEPSRAPENFIKPTSLNPAYTFESYVVGVCNRLSHAAALAI